jgi:hypothetical protein
MSSSFGVRGLTASTGRVVGAGQEMGEVDAHRREGAAEFHPLALVARDADGRQPLRPERRQVRQDVPAAARLRPHSHHVVHRQPRLDRRLRQRGVDVQVSIQRDVADEDHAERPLARRDLVEAFRLHGSVSTAGCCRTGSG